MVGRVAVARVRGGVHVRVHRRPAGSVHLAANGQRLRGVRASADVELRTSDAVLEPAAGMDHVPPRRELQADGAGPRVDHPWPDRMVWAGDVARRDERARRVRHGNAARNRMAVRGLDDRDLDRRFRQHLVPGAIDQRQLANHHIVRSAARAVDAELVRPGSNEARRHIQVGHRLVFVRRQRRECLPVHQHTPGRFQIAMTESQRARAAVRARVEGEHELTPVRTPGEFRPLAGGT